MSQVSEVIVHWTPRTSSRTASIQIQSRIKGTTEWTEQASAYDPSVGEFAFTSNAPATDIEVRTRFRNSDGVFDDEWHSAEIRTADAVVEYDRITGLPIKLSDINPHEGDKLTGIEPGATVGAPIGTNIGPFPVATIVGSWTDTNGNLINVRSNFDEINDQIDGHIAALNQRSDNLSSEIDDAKDDIASTKTDLTRIEQEFDGKDQATKGLIEDEGIIRARETDALAVKTDKLVAQMAGTEGSYLNGRITDEIAALATADDVITSRTNTIEAVASGLGGNLVSNSSFEVDTNGWGTDGNATGTTWSRNAPSDDWRPIGESALSIHQNGVDQSHYAQWHTEQFAIAGDTWYEASAYVAAHGCQVSVRAALYDAAGNDIMAGQNGGSHIVGTIQAHVTGGRDLTDWRRSWVKFKTPNNARRIVMIFGKDGTQAAANRTDSWGWMCRPMIRETVEGALSPLPYTAASSRASLNRIQSKITTQETALATQESSIASLRTTVESSSGGNPNLLPNGGFNRGMYGWNMTHTGWNYGVSGGWGQIAFRSWSWDGPHCFIESSRIPIFGNQVYTASGDHLYARNAGDGHCYVELVWYDGAGNFITQNNGNGDYSSHDFSTSTAQRAAIKCTAAAPPNATQVVVRLVHYAAPNANGHIVAIGWRNVKLEAGDKMTAYSQEASVTNIMEAVTSADGKANQALARAGVRLDVNGYVTGWETNNNGTQGNFKISADHFEIVSPNGGPAGLTFSNNQLRINHPDGSLNVRMGWF